MVFTNDEDLSDVALSLNTTIMEESPVFLFNTTISLSTLCESVFRHRHAVGMCTLFKLLSKKILKNVSIFLLPYACGGGTHDHLNHLII